MSENTKQLLINHICLTIQNLSQLIVATELGDLTEEQITEQINKAAEKLILVIK